MLDVTKLPFLNTEAGLAFCCDDLDIYEDILLTYMMEPRREGLEEALEHSDWKSYETQVHAMKSASKLIGADHLSEEAAIMEKAAKEEKAEQVKKGHLPLMEEYSTLISLLNEVLADCASAEDIELWDEDEELEDEALDIKSDAFPAEAKIDDVVDVKKQEVRDKMHAVDVSGSYILVVDDDAINIQIAKNMLGDKYEVGSADCGEKVLNCVKERIPDLILLDVHMTGMSGHDVIKQLKSVEEYKEIPVIFLTADNDDETEIQGFNEGAMDYIRKPFRKEIALHRIDRILELSYLQNYLLSEVDKQTRKAESRRKKVERLTLMIIKALANTIDAKDKYTKGHSSRVAEYACMIAQKMGYSDDDVQNMNYIALLHDLGKIGIPDQIINKPGKLNDEEYAIIKTHPVIGANILKDVTELPNIEIGAKWHHERYDGKGYPDGMAGDMIPIVARIIGVADAYDAMTSKRSYRDVLPQAVVREEIEKCLGTQFDPDIGRIMLQIMDEDTEYKLHE